ncbi:hypothetical protein E3O47_00355 [Cryobacterium sp. TMT2-17-1]|uniref:hypothetical protein n=1 Tax=Cryobacterium sp. TMT2-17-1 TaxID=1259248 RepID=UPI00106C60D9|nr:hypothetical protein [Cryobacterium sp. TMT2-17-1]TFC55364.1 hypothetical protein E3O47_00355 [Cryobacterium sp. TMT2-17-1]
MTLETGPRKTGRGARSNDPEAVERRQRLDEWQRGVTDQTIANILHFRDVRRMSNDALRERLALLGWDLTKDSLASILSGSSKRKIMPAADVLLFAWALNVPPIALLFPVRTDARVALAPAAGARSVSAHRAALWFAGNDLGIPSPVEFSEEFDRVEDFLEVGDIVTRLVEHDALVHEFGRINCELMLGQSADLREKEFWKATAGEHVQDLIETRRFMRKHLPDLTLPRLRRPLQFVDDERPIMPSFPLPNYNTADELKDGRPRSDDWREDEPTA